jgi:hypothetical protein
VVEGVEENSNDGLATPPSNSTESKTRGSNPADDFLFLDMQPNLTSSHGKPNKQISVTVTGPASLD